MDEQTPNPNPEIPPLPPAKPQKATSKSRTPAKKKTGTAKPKSAPKVASTPSPPVLEDQSGNGRDLRAAVPPVPQVETVFEAMAPAHDMDDLLDFYVFVHADPEKQYYVHNPSSENHARHGSNPINLHYLYTRFYRREQVDVPAEKMLMLIYNPGHPEHPAGFQQIVPKTSILLARPIRFMLADREKQFKKDNPGYDPAESEDLVQLESKNGVVRLDKKSAFVPGSNELGNMLPTKEQLVRNEARIQAARERMPDEFYDALNDAAERALAS